VILLPPVDRAARVFAIAQNYPAHAAEYGGPRPPAPVIFMKPSSSLSGANQDIELPGLSKFFDYEGELAAVVGRRGRNVPPEHALECIAGYTICNDGSARDLQDTTLAGKPIIDWFSGKSLDGCSPVGPWIVSRDQVQDPQNLHLQTRLNGVTVQDERTAAMVFSLAEQVTFISQRLALEPGDLISTGTPAGVGKARGRPLQAGDELEIEIEGIGILRNRFIGSAGQP
jgi:2-keto-4-pentenoate hydratase/2-oxohepta-3-ene-1,7-dioic acid hydratase in catechol pathway